METLEYVANRNLQCIFEVVASFAHLLTKSIQTFMCHFTSSTKSDNHRGVFSSKRNY